MKYVVTIYTPAERFDFIGMYKTYDEAFNQVAKFDDDPTIDAVIKKADEKAANALMNYVSDMRRCVSNCCNAMRNGDERPLDDDYFVDMDIISAIIDILPEA